MVKVVSFGTTKFLFVLITLNIVFSFPSLNTTIGPLLFADQYLQLYTSIASSVISGLGEHYTPITLDLNWSSVSLWNRDMAPHVRPSHHFTCFFNLPFVYSCIYCFIWAFVGKCQLVRLPPFLFGPRR